jgi:hypothetical protein
MADTRPAVHVSVKCPNCDEPLLIEARLTDGEIVRYMEWYEQTHPAPAEPPKPATPAA